MVPTSLQKEALSKIHACKDVHYEQGLQSGGQAFHNIEDSITPVHVPKNSFPEVNLL